MRVWTPAEFGSIKASLAILKMCDRLRHVEERNIPHWLAVDA